MITVADCHQGICESWLYKISSAADGGNLQVNLGGVNDLDNDLWYFVFVPGYTDEAMIVNYGNHVFWSVIHEADQSRIDVASTDCSNAPKFRIVYHRSSGNAGPGYYTMFYTDQSATNTTFRLNSALMELEKVASSFNEVADLLKQIPIEERFDLNPYSSAETQVPSWIPSCFYKKTWTNSISELRSSVGNFLAGTALLVDASNGTEHPSTIEEKYAGLWTILPICKNRSPMSSNTQKISRVINTLGAFWVVACMTFTFTLMLILREWSYERYIHICQEIVLLLIHLIVVFTAQRTDREAFPQQ
uniref:Uncharacterized protein n=1 Tax=Romanomermis culicivorax TaxID=13658 RepID=A0A915J223_ROMCU